MVEVDASSHTALWAVKCLVDGSCIRMMALLKKSQWCSALDGRIYTPAIQRCDLPLPRPPTKGMDWNPFQSLQHATPRHPAQGIANGSRSSGCLCLELKLVVIGVLGEERGGLLLVRIRVLYRDNHESILFPR